MMAGDLKMGSGRLSTNEFQKMSKTLRAKEVSTGHYLEFIVTLVETKQIYSIHAHYSWKRSYKCNFSAIRSVLGILNFSTSIN